MASTALQTLAAMSRPSSEVRVRDGAHARELFDGVYAEFVEKANMDPEHAIPSVLAMLDLTFDAEGMPQWSKEGEDTIKGDAAIEYAWRNNVHVVNQRRASRSTETRRRWRLAKKKDIYAGDARCETRSDARLPDEEGTRLRGWWERERRGKGVGGGPLT